ncbi:MAG: hypothetical protein ACI9J3_000062 [Parvicellaceae bacterium]|jgi:hypothetical protein
MTKFFTFFFICLAVVANGQSSLSGSLTSHVNSLIDNLPGSGGLDYNNPSSTGYSSWITLISDFTNGVNVTTSASNFGYDFIEFTDGTDQYYILQPEVSGSKF